jgi:hypothetical protein
MFVLSGAQVNFIARMHMAVYIETRDLAFNVQLKNMASKIGKYADTLGLTSDDVAGLQADAAAIDYITINQLAVQSFAENHSSFKKSLRRGSVLAQGVLPTPPVFGTAPPMPKHNVEGRLRLLMQRISHHPRYNSAIGEDLGIEAPVKTFAPKAGKPVFTIVLVEGGRPKLRWVKKKFQGVEIWKDVGQGFAKLDRDMMPDYIDKSALPALGISATWRYKMIYLLNDEVMGSWSDEVSITVHGEV